MKDLFDDHIKNKLEQASPEELGYRPDREQLWKQVSGRQRKTIPFSRWLSHAAAVAAGLILGFIFLYNRQQPQPAEKVVAQEQTRTRVDTVYITQQATPSAPATVAEQQPATPRKGGQQATTNQVPEQQAQLAVQHQEPDQKEQPVVASAASTSPKKQVLHLTDIDNENAGIPQPYRNKVDFYKALSVLNNDHSTEKATISMRIGKVIFNTPN